jgi:Tfp pilus assembly protein PilV
MRLHPRPRRGVSLTEVVVAVLLFGIACLALLSSQTVLTALRSRATIRWSLANWTLNTLDSLRAASCTALASTTRTSRDGSLTWIVTPQGQVVHLALVVAPRSAAAWRTETLVPCAT